MNTPANTPADPRRLHHGDTRSPLGSLLGVNADIRLPNWNANLALTAFVKPPPPAPASSLKPPQVQCSCVGPTNGPQTLISDLSSLRHL